MDSLLSTVQMPQGVPVATVAIGKAGARNAAILAVQMMGLGNPEYLDKIAEFKKEQAEKVLAQSVVE
jgi:5-(carboxyamino)imidazole ribonucleotide mutase